MNVTVNYGGSKRDAIVADGSTVAEILEHAGIPATASVSDAETGARLAQDDHLVDGQAIVVTPKVGDGGSWRR